MGLVDACFSDTKSSGRLRINNVGCRRAQPLATGSPGVRLHSLQLPAYSAAGG